MGEGGAAFDAVAGDYDRSFTNSWPGRIMRDQVHRHLADVFEPGAEVLDLGCGTGEDAIWLAQHGVHVTGVDASAAMLAVASRKAVVASVEDRITLTQADLTCGSWRFARGGSAPKFDGALANFGVLNCVEDRRALAAELAASLRPGAPLVVVVMGPFCLSEVALHLLRGDVRTAARRWRPGAPARVGSDASVPVWYPTPGRLRAEFGPWFALRRRAGIGAILPPGTSNRWQTSRPRVAEALVAAEHRVASAPWSAWIADHHLAVLERR